MDGQPAPQQTFDQATNQLQGVTYDAAGNVWQWNDGATLHTYIYDAEGRLLQVDTGINYVYDAFGRRVEKVVNGAKTEYVYDLAGNEVAELDGTSGSVIRNEIWAGARHLGTYVGGTTYFSHQDWLGTERMRSNMTPDIAQTCTSNPYGDALACSGTAGISDVGFAGMEYDSETGFYHTLFRYYNPQLTTWMTTDPAGIAVMDPMNPRSLNRYAYVFNAPIASSDLSGLSPIGYCKLVDDDSDFDPEPETGALDNECASISWYAGGGGMMQIDGIPVPVGLFGGEFGAGGESSVPCFAGDCSGYGTRWDVNEDGHVMRLVSSKNNGLNSNYMSITSTWKDEGPVWLATGTSPVDTSQWPLVGLAAPFGKLPPGADGLRQAMKQFAEGMPKQSQPTPVRPVETPPPNVVPNPMENPEFLLLKAIEQLLNWTGLNGGSGSMLYFIDTRRATNPCAIPSWCVPREM